jgi:hypothetical protein
VCRDLLDYSQWANDPGLRIGLPYRITRDPQTVAESSGRLEAIMASLVVLGLVVRRPALT